MREVSEALESILTGSREVSSSVGVFYDGEPVSDEIPLADGSLSLDATQSISGALEASLPRYVLDELGAQIDMLPTNGGPLSADGTQLALTYYVGLPGRDREAVALGWYRISDWEEGDGTVEVTAPTLEALIAEARFLDPLTIAASTSYTSAVTTLVGELLPLEVTATGGTFPGQTFEDDRYAALLEVLTAWPARKYVDGSGTLVIAPPFDDALDPVVATLTDGEGGTVVHVPRSGTRDGKYNAVKATGETTGTTLPVSGVAYLSTGPRRWNGPFGNVPYFYSSPLLTTKVQAQSAARTILNRLQIGAVPIQITAAPDPRLEVGDVIQLHFEGLTQLVRIDAVTLPLTAAGGAMTVIGHEITRGP